MAATFSSIDDYIASYPEDVQVILEQVRATIRAAVPDAGEKISYQMPTITLDEQSLVYFARLEAPHRALSDPPGGRAARIRAQALRGAKDAVKFPLREPMPHDLIARLTELLVTRRRARGE